MKTHNIKNRFFSKPEAAIECMHEIASRCHITTYVLQMLYGFRLERVQYSVRTIDEMVCKPRKNDLNSTIELHECVKSMPGLIYAVEYRKKASNLVDEDQSIRRFRTISKNDISLYSDFHNANIGYYFMDTNSGRIFTKHEMYLYVIYKYSDLTDVKEALSGITANTMPGISRYDKKGWKNGSLIKTT